MRCQTRFRQNFPEAISRTRIIGPSLCGTIPNRRPAENDLQACLKNIREDHTFLLLLHLNLRSDFDNSHYFSTSLYPEGTVKSDEGIEETSILFTSE